jgi:FAD/FMN-containing dehydrogenase
MVEHSTAAQILGEATVTEFRASMRGVVLGPEDEGYELHRRVWNGMIDKRPRLIARCTGVADVLAAVQFARTQDLPLAVRSGGHNVAGHAVCDDGLVIDLSLMKGVRVDPTTRRVQAEVGLTWGELDRETQAFGLATPGGMVSTTGITGLTLGGGVGWLLRKYGLACDNLLAVDVVTADGRFLAASETEHADLFWGLRGGGGNFGIVTSLQYRLHPVTTVLGGVIVYPFARARELLRFYREFCATASDELTTLATFMTLPADPSLPEQLHNLPAVIIGVCHTGPVDEAERAVQPLRTVVPPLLDALSLMSYSAVQTMQDAFFPAGLQHYWRSAYLGDLGDDAIDALIDHADVVTLPLTGIDIHHMGGAMARVAADATAFGHRDAPYLVNMYAIWTNPSEAERHIAWLRGLTAALGPCSRGVYVNFLADEGEEGVRAAYDVAAYERLVALKNKYDPLNLFRLNQNIRPRPA